MVANLHNGGLYWRSFGRLHSWFDAHTSINIIRNLGWFTAASKKIIIIIIISGVNIDLKNVTLEPLLLIHDCADILFLTTEKIVKLFTFKNRNIYCLQFQFVVPARSVQFICWKSDIRVVWHVQRGTHGTYGYSGFDDLQHAPRTWACIWYASMFHNGCHSIFDGCRGIRYVFRHKTRVIFIYST